MRTCTQHLTLATIGCTLLAGLVCCHRDSPSEHALAAAARVEAIWDQRTAALTSANAKQRFADEGQAFLKVLGECSQAERDELLEVAAAAPGGNDKNGFPRVTISGLIIFYAAAADRASLVQVLAKAAPQKVALRDMEDFVVLASPKIPDSVTMLFDAFDSSKSADARSAIADGLRRGFAFAGPLPEEDAALVAWARTWYDEHRATHVPDREYSQNFPVGLDGVEYHPLFKPK